MPIYEYECGKCQHRLETLQKISDAPLLQCPICHEDALKKLVSASVFRLKGGGWYETDFKTGNKKNLSGDSSQGDAQGKDATGGKDSTGGKNGSPGKGESGGKEGAGSKGKEKSGTASTASTAAKPAK